MKVLFDHQIFVTQRYGGVSRYFTELASALNALPQVDASVFAPLHVNGYLDRCKASQPFTFTCQFPKQGRRFRPGLIAPWFRMFSAASGADVVHETYYGHSIERRGRRPAVVTTVHDMVVETHPQLFDGADARIAYKRRSMQLADRLICISENTRRDVADRYPEFANKLAVVHHGVAHEKSPKDQAPPIDKPYILFVGVRSGYKNFASLLSAAGRSSFVRNNFSILCFGGGSFRANELDLAHEVGFPLRQLQQLTGTDEQLANAYRHATVFVFPSHYEGFGMPLTEAMVQSCPILCSQASCFPEICEDAAAYFDPWNEESIRECMESTLSSASEIERLAQAAELRSLSFSWQKCALETAKVYEELI